MPVRHDVLGARGAGKVASNHQSFAMFECREQALCMRVAAHNPLRS